MEVSTRLFVLLMSSAVLVASAAAVAPVPKLEIGSKKILVLLPVAAPSHHNLFSSLTNELMDRGHHVTIVSSLPQKTKHPRLREIAVRDPFEEFNKMKVDLFKGPGHPFTNIVIMYLIGTLLNTVVLESPEALALKNEKFDLVITETYFFQEPLLAFAHHFGCPSMTLSPFGYSQELNEFTGGAVNPAHVPNLYGNGAKLDTFWNRLANTVNTIASSLSFHLYYYHKCNALMHTAFPDAPPLYDLLNNVSLTLINNNAALMPAVALSPSVIEVAGMQIRPGKPLSADLQKWIEDSKDGIVYFSLGSNLKAHLLAPEKKEAIFASFAKLKQRVLVKWNGEIPANAPKNCRFETWVPQQEVLVHPKLKVFVTHGGLLSTQESIYYGAPVIGMPVYGDQFMNMERAQQQGFGKMVSIFDLKMEALDDALNEVINNPKYREQALKFKERFRSDPIPPLEKAVYYTELLMKLGDLKHLQPSSVHLHWYQYLLLDVAAVIIFGLYVTWRVIRCLCSACLGCCRKSPKAKKD